MAQSAPVPQQPPAPPPASNKALTQYRHDVWQTTQGLPQNSVKAMVLRRDGYLWLGTESGLVRFDGLTFKIFDRQSTPALKDPDVTALFEDAKGDLWIGTDSGQVFLYARDEFAAYETRGVQTRPVRAFFQDKAGTIWMGLGERVMRLSATAPASATQRVFVAIDGARGTVHDFDQDPQGTLWAATSTGMARISGDRVLPADNPNNIRAAIRDRQQTLWLATSEGIVRMAGRERRRFTVEHGLPSNDCRALLEGADGAIWIGTTGGGLARIANDRIQSYTAADGLSDATVLALAADHEDSVWIGTLAGGLNRLRGVPFFAVTRHDGLPVEDILSVYEDRAGRVWVGTDGGGLTKYTPGQSPVTYTTEDGLPSNVIRTTWQASDGSLWVGTGDRGLARYAEGEWTAFASRPEMPQGAIRAIYQDRSGTLWIGNRDGLHRIRAGAITTFTTHQGLSSNNISSIREDNEGTLWIGTLEGGLNRMKNDSFSAYTTAQGLSTNDVSAVAVAGRNVWVGTFDGRLHLVRNDRALALPVRDDVKMGRVLQILDDERGSLWVSSQRGIVRYDQGDLLNVANGAKPYSTPRIFDRLEGFGRWEFNGLSQTSGWRRRDSRMLFASAGGVIGIDPAKLTRSSFVPPVQIERIVSAGAELPLPLPARADFDLPSGQDQLEFHYTALSYAVPERVRFKYRLEGVDRDWVEAGTRRVAYYTNVPGGRYRFHVIAANHDGVWSPVGATLYVNVGTPFYATWWFYSLVGVVALVGVAVLLRWRVRRLQERERALAKLVEERTSALQQEISERHKVEASLRQSKDVLEDRVRERTNELAAAYAQLQEDVAERRRLEEQLAQVQKLESIGRLAGGVAHDLNNVLTVVLSYSDLLDSGLGPAHPLQAQLRQIRKAAERASNLTHRLLAFARQQVLEPRVINLSELTLSLDGMLRRLIGEDIELVTLSKSGLWSAKADPHQIEQVLVNLVINARDAMPRGGKLTIETQNAIIDDTAVWKNPALVPGEYVLLTVKDSGVGMSDYVKQHLFEPFFTTKETGKGTGLGLATCYGIVQQLGGHIVVESEPGHGAMFKVFLRRVDLPAEPTKADTKDAVLRVRGSETVLLVEDEPLVRQIAESALSDQGYRVLEAENGEEALRVAVGHEEEEIALVLTDVVMPRMGGRELTERLREQRPGIRVLYMSGYAAATIDEQDVIEPGTAFLRKPFTLRDMLRKVRDVLDEQTVTRH